MKNLQTFLGLFITLAALGANESDNSFTLQTGFRADDPTAQTCYISPVPEDIYLHCVGRRELESSLCHAGLKRLPPPLRHYRQISPLRGWFCPPDKAVTFAIIHIKPSKITAQFTCGRDVRSDEILRSINVSLVVLTQRF